MWAQTKKRADDTLRYYIHKTDPKHKWSLQSFMQEPAFVVALAPAVLFFLTLAIGTYLAPDAPLPHGVHVDLGLVTWFIDFCVRVTGPLLPFVLFLVQWAVLPYHDLQNKKVVRSSHDVPCLPASMTGAFLAIWVIIAGVRMVMYLTLKQVNYYFSDHIFLLVSMLAQLQTKLFVAVHAHQMNGETDLRPRAKACVVLGLFLVAGMCWEGFVTSRYYHTWEAVWLAWLVGTFIFGSFTFWWIGVVRYEEKKQEPLLPENPSNSFNNNA